MELLASSTTAACVCTVSDGLVYASLGASGMGGLQANRAVSKGSAFTSLGASCVRCFQGKRAVGRGAQRACRANTCKPARAWSLPWRPLRYFSPSISLPQLSASLTQAWCPFPAPL